MTDLQGIQDTNSLSKQDWLLLSYKVVGMGELSLIYKESINDQTQSLKHQIAFNKCRVLCMPGRYRVMEEGNV